MGNSDTIMKTEINNEADRDKLTILIVDKKETGSDLEKDIERLGHRVLIAGNYTEALQKLSKTRFDLVVLDVDLTDGGRIKIISKIRTLADDVNIVTMTNNNNREREQEIRDQRILYYAVKPLEFDEIRSIIDHISLKKKANRKGE
ncbi:MAG: response regulator [Desulfobacteraceae bacterium]|jgi:two-component system response regulator PilR (NtrC family)